MHTSHVHTYTSHACTLYMGVHAPLCTHTVHSDLTCTPHTMCTHNIQHTLSHTSHIHHTCYAIQDITHHTHHTSRTYHTCKTPPHPHHKCMQSLHTDLTHATQHNTWHTLTAHAHAIDRTPYPLHPHPTNKSHTHNAPHAHNTHTGHTSALCTMSPSALSLPVPLILCPGPSLSPLTTP